VTMTGGLSPGHVRRRPPDLPETDTSRSRRHGKMPGDRARPHAAARPGSARPRSRASEHSPAPPEIVMAAAQAVAGSQAALTSMILYFSAPRGAATSTVSPFFLPMIALPTGDSFESFCSRGFASAEPTITYSIV